VVISYHSLEDRIVKQFMQQEARGCICPPRTPVCICGHTPRIKLLNRKVITPTEIELKNNPRSRSARLRAAECIISQSDSYSTTKDHKFITIAKSNSWLRPVILQKSKVFILAA
jgi:16S rRNA (cytosine1402-N4)-methyltransferase